MNSCLFLKICVSCVQIAALFGAYPVLAFLLCSIRSIDSGGCSADFALMNAHVVLYTLSIDFVAAPLLEGGEKNLRICDAIK